MKPKLTTDIDSKKIYYGIVLVSIVLAIGFYYLLQLFQSISIWLMFIEFGSVFGFYMLLINIFDKYVWKWKVLYILGLLAYPDLSGTWKGTLTSYKSSEQSSSKHEVDVVISQTWLTMSIQLKTKQSHSHNKFAYMYTENSIIHIVYEYSNNPDVSIKYAKEMFDHYGFVKMELNNAHNLIKGEYYNDPSRSTKGCFELHKA